MSYYYVMIYRVSAMLLRSERMCCFRFVAEKVVCFFLVGGGGGAWKRGDAYDQQPI